MWKGRFHWMRSNLPAMLLFDWYNLDHKSLTQLEPTHILQLSPAEQHHFVHTVHMYVIVCTAKKYRFKHVPLDITCSLIKSKILWYCKSGMSSLFLMSSFKRVPFFLNKTSAFSKLTLSSPVYIHPTHLQTPLSCIALGVRVLLGFEACQLNNLRTRETHPKEVPKGLVMKVFRRKKEIEQHFTYVTQVIWRKENREILSRT